MKLRHIDMAAGLVNQNAREVKTKFSKTFNTFFFPVRDEVLEIVSEWVSYLRDEKLWGNDDPIFPATRIIVGNSRHFEAVGLERKHWSTDFINIIKAVIAPPLPHTSLGFPWKRGVTPWSEKCILIISPI